MLNPPHLQRSYSRSKSHSPSSNVIGVRSSWTDIDNLKNVSVKCASCPEDDALEKLQHWLEINSWKDIQANLLDAGYTRYEKYSQIEPHMMALDEASGLYLYQGRTLQLVGPDRSQSDSAPHIAKALGFSEFC